MSTRHLATRSRGTAATACPIGNRLSRVRLHALVCVERRSADEAPRRPEIVKAGRRFCWEGLRQGRQRRPCIASYYHLRVLGRTNPLADINAKRCSRFRQFRYNSHSTVPQPQHPAIERQVTCHYADWQGSSANPHWQSADAQPVPQIPILPSSITERTGIDADLSSRSP